MTRVSAAVLCHDEGRLLASAIDALAAQSTPPVETLVVDAGSTDVFTRQALGGLAGRGILSLGAEAATALNTAMRAARGDAVLLLGASVLARPECLTRAVASLAPSGVVLLRADGDPPLDPLTCLAFGADPAAALVTRDLWLEAAGGFDESQALQVLDLWLTALERGAGVVALPEPLADRARRASTALHDGDLFTKHRAYLETLDPEDLLPLEDAIVATRDRLHDVNRRRAKARGDLDARRAELAAAGGSSLDWGELRRTTPLSARWGLERGRPLDRFYIERFLEAHRRDVRGRVLEVKDGAYTRRFGTAVTRADVLDVNPRNPNATVRADLESGAGVPEGAYDCFVLTQTLHEIYDVRSALRNAVRALAPGGVLLATLPAVSRVDDEEGGLDGGDFWRFTEAAVRRLFAEALPPQSFEVTAYGNVLAGAAFLYGVAAEELTADELLRHDPLHPVLFGARAVKPIAPGTGAILAYHRVADLSPDPHRLCTPPALFREHLRLLSRGFRVVPLAGLAAAPAGSVAITLDDGTADALVAAASLVEAGLPATFFLSSEGLGEEPWWDELADVFLSGRPLPERLEVDATGYDTSSAAARDRAHAQLHARLLREGPERDRTMRAIRDWSGRGSSARESHRRLTPGEVRALAGMPGVEVGAHGARHLWLPGLGAAEACTEVVACREALARLAGREVQAFSYPYGAWDEPAAELVRKAGYRVAVTVEPRAVRPGDDARSLPRLDVSGLAAGALQTRLERLVVPGDSAPSARRGAQRRAQAVD